MTRSLWPLAVPLLVSCLFGCASPAAAAPDRVAVGLERLQFRDDRLDEVYGGTLGVSISGDLVERRWGRLRLHLTLVPASGDPATPEFVDQAETGLLFLPLRIQWLNATELGTNVRLWGGPAATWTWFRESLDVEVPGAGVRARPEAVGTWLGAGALGGVRWCLGTAGALRLAYEWMWAPADRRVVPGNENQKTDMTGGWTALSLAWEVPWIE